MNTILLMNRIKLQVMEMQHYLMRFIRSKKSSHKNDENNNNNNAKKKIKSSSQAAAAAAAAIATIRLGRRQLLVVLFLLVLLFLLLLLFFVLLMGLTRIFFHPPTSTPPHQLHYSTRQKATTTTTTPIITIDRIYYINLEKNVQRRQFMEEWLQKQPIPYERIEAKVGGPDLCGGAGGGARDGNINNNNNMRVDGDLCRGLSGLALTQLHILEEKNTTGYTLVLEDDYRINNMTQLLDSIQYVPQDWDILRWQCGGTKRSDISYVPSSFEVSFWKQQRQQQQQSSFLNNGDNGRGGDGEDHNNDNTPSNNNKNKKNANVDNNNNNGDDNGNGNGNDDGDDDDTLVVFQTAHVNKCRRWFRQCTYCGRTHVMLWRNDKDHSSSLQKLYKVWSQQPFTAGIDCRLTTPFLKSYCINHYYDSSRRKRMSFFFRNNNYNNNNNNAGKKPKDNKDFGVFHDFPGEQSDINNDKFWLRWMGPPPQY